jgi:alpha-mannosidase
MDQYPEYKFMSSTPLLYQFVKEDYPEIYEKIKARISEGRWEADGGMWIESDCNMVSGRSLSRQFLYGKRFFQSEFAVDSKILWLPDAFGYCPSLPQIMKKSGIDYFVSCKMGWNDSNRLPNDTFYWKGIDGSEILSHMITTTYPRQSVTSYATDYNGQLFPETVMGAWNTYRQQDISKDVLITFGYGDGGGGPTKEMLENQRRMSKGIPGCPKTNIRSVGQYFNDLSSEIESGKKLPKWSGELYLETHRGTYTSMARNKKSNRYCDMLLGKAEKLASLDMLISDKKYPQEILEKHWKTVLMNQFHDILPGSSIKEVYEVTKEEYEFVENDLEGMNKKLLTSIVENISAKEKTLVLFNSLGFERSDIVEIEGDFDDNINLLDIEDDRKIEVQKSSKGIVFYAERLPSLGYKKYSIVSARDKSFDDELFYMNVSSFENKYYKVKLDESGAFKSIYDKTMGREIIKEGQLANRLVCYENKPHIYDNWNIDANYREKSWDIDDLISIDVIEDGPVRKVLQIKKGILDSTVVQDIILYRDSRRIDFKTVIDMKMTDVLIKCQFPLDINTDFGTFETAYGSCRRSSHENTSWDMANYEVPGHRWADLSEGNYGVALLNDSRYGYSIKGNDIALSLVKPGTYPNPDADIEVHELIYSLYSHSNSVLNSDTHKEGEKINEPLKGVLIDERSGKFEENLSFFELDCDNIIIDSVKKCEESDDIIVTCYEHCNRRSKVVFKSYFNISRVWECDLTEKNITEYEHSDNKIEFDMKAFEIKVFKISFQK